MLSMEAVIWLNYSQQISLFFAQMDRSTSAQLCLPFQNNVVSFFTRFLMIFFFNPERLTGRTVMGRSRKPYFGEAGNDGERSGLLSSSSQEAIADTASNPPSPRGQYEGLGRTFAPHSLSAPAELSSAPWDDGYDAQTEESLEEARADQSKGPTEGDLIVIT